MIRIEDIFKKKKKKIVDGLELEIDDIKTDNVLGMLNHLVDYMQEKEGKLKSIYWRGMEKNPLKVEKVYSFGGAELTVDAEKMRFHDDRYHVRLKLTSKKAVDDLAKKLCVSCFRKHLIPEDAELIG